MGLVARVGGFVESVIARRRGFLVGSGATANVSVRSEPPADDLPPGVARCWSARRDIGSELLAILNRHSAPVEEHRNAWQHAAERARNEGFETITVPLSELRDIGPEPKRVMSIVCEHADCLAHACEGTYIATNVTRALIGFEQSGLSPYPSETEECLARRGGILSEIIPGMATADGFRIPGTLDIPDDLTLEVLNGGGKVELACSHDECRTARQSSLIVGWEPKFAAGSV